MAESKHAYEENKAATPADRAVVDALVLQDAARGVHLEVNDLEVGLRALVHALPAL